MAFDLPLATLSAISFAMPGYILASQNPVVDSEMSTLVAFAAVIFFNFIFNRYAAWCFAFFAQTVVSGALQYCKFNVAKLI